MHKIKLISGLLYVSRAICHCRATDDATRTLHFTLLSVIITCIHTATGKSFVSYPL